MFNYNDRMMKQPVSIIVYSKFWSLITETLVVIVFPIYFLRLEKKSHLSFFLHLE